MASVLIPQAQQKKDPTSSLMTVGGMAAGALAGGGDPGAITAGAGLGGTLGGLASSQMQQTPSAGAQGIQTGGSDKLNATQRRLEELKNQKTMAQAYEVAQQNPQLQQEYGAILKNALDRARAGTGVA